MRWRFYLLYSLPISLILFSWVGARAKIQLVDGPAINFYGFPFLWHCHDLASSLRRQVNLYALALDLGIFLASASLIGRTDVAHRLVAQSPLFISLFLWIGGGLSVFALCATFSFGTTLGGVGMAGALLEYRPHLGMHFPS